MERPQVKNYLNCFQFLQDIYRFNKITTENFSYQIWCHNLGMRSKSYLRFVILGKRKISKELLFKILCWLDFQNKSDEDYFLHLVQYSQTEDEKLKTVISKKMIDLIKLEDSQKMTVTIKPRISDPICLQIRDLVSYDDVLHTTESIAQIFTKEMSQVKLYLDILVSEKLVYLDANNFWRSTHQSIKIADDQGNAKLQDFHEKSLSESILMIKSNLPFKRYRSLHLTLADREFDEVNDKINTFLTELFAQYSQDTTSAGKKIFQINYNISPRTNIIEPR